MPSPISLLLWNRLRWWLGQRLIKFSFVSFCSAHFLLRLIFTPPLSENLSALWKKQYRHNVIKNVGFFCFFLPYIPHTHSQENIEYFALISIGGAMIAGFGGSQLLGSVFACLGKWWYRFVIFVGRRDVEIGSGHARQETQQKGFFFKIVHEICLR